MVERSLSDEEPGRSAAASKESSEKTTSELRRKLREREEAQREWVSTECAIFVRREEDELQCQFQSHFEICGVR
jgi:hypothetical protein